MTTVRYDLPTPEGDTIEYREAAKDGRLLIKHCKACGKFSYYPRPFCPECWSEDVEWHEASGRATLYTWSVIYNNDQPIFRDRVPYVAAIVDLEEGPRMMTNVIDTPFEDLSVGMALSVTYMPISDEYTIPVFIPREGLKEDTMGDAVITSAVRTPISRSGRSLAALSLADIGGAVVAAAIERGGFDAEEIDDLILGETLQGGGCTARYIANALGLPPDTPGLSVQRQCATGMAAVQDAAAQIMAGMIDVAVAGGIESMTRFPAMFATSPFPFGGMERFIPPSHPDTADAPNMNMLITVGENTASECGITREEQDEWSLHSNLRAIAAADEGRFDAEMIPVAVPSGRGETTMVSVDEHPRRDTTLEKLAALPVLTGPGGTITAGNSSGIGDGGAALVVADRAKADAAGAETLAIVRSWASVGVEPRHTGLAPTIAVPRALDRAGLSTKDVDLVEINEAFASMAVASSRKLGFDHDIVNVNGGAVGIGHPVGCSGARILVTLIHELRRRGGGIGVATLCAGGGMGSATVIEVPAPA